MRGVLMAFQFAALLAVPVGAIAWAWPDLIRAWKEEDE